MCDEVIQRVLLELAEQFGDLDDTDDAPFGEFARVDLQPGHLDVRHADHPWGIRIKIYPLHDA